MPGFNGEDSGLAAPEGCGYGYAVDLAAERSEAGAVEHFGGGIPDFLHCQVYTAHCLITAVGAGHVGGLAGAGDGRKRAVEHAHDLAKVDIRWIPGEEIAATFALPALEDSVVLEAEQDEFEELRGDLLRAGKIDDSHRLAPLMIGETEKCFDGVLGLL
jgi:hypothetical protein